MSWTDDLDSDEEFRKLARSIQDPFNEHVGLEWQNHVSEINPDGSYERDIEIATQSMLNAVEEESYSGREFLYDFNDNPGRVSLIMPGGEMLASGEVIAGNFGDPTYDDMEKASPDSFLVELEKTYQNILNKHSDSREYLTPRSTDDINNNLREFGSVYSIDIPSDFNEEEVEMTVQAIIDTSDELNDLADHLIDYLRDYRND